MRVTVRFPVPELEIVSVRVGFLSRVRLARAEPNARSAERPMMREWTPVPLALMVEFPEVALEFTVMVPLKGPSLVGRKKTGTFREAVALIVPLQFPLKPGG